MGWIVVQHVAWEGPGLIEAVGRERGIHFSLRRMDCGDDLPSADEIDGLVVMGGPMSAWETGKHPNLSAEVKLLREATSRGLSVLGVCLGSQLLAAALGARVYGGGAGQEIGPGEVEVTSAGRADPVLGPEGDLIPVFHWHGDTFDLPQGAVHLARTALYPHQAFRAGRHAYAFQFHIEVDRTLAEAWAPRLGPAAIDEGRRREIEARGRSILGRFFDAAKSGRR